MERPYSPRLFGGNVSGPQLSPTERKSVHELVRSLRLPRASAAQALRLGVVGKCLSYRRAREITQHAPERPAVLAELEVIEKHASALHLATAAGTLSLEARARIEDVDGAARAPAPESWERLRHDLLWLGSRAHHARATLSEEGASGGSGSHADADPAVNGLLFELHKLWTESGLRATQGAGRKRGKAARLSRWERFAVDVVAIAKPDTHRNEGLRFARRLAAKRPT